MRFVGSSNSIPTCPRLADASTSPSNASRCLPDTSTCPPCPPSAPPRELMAPSNRVSPSDHTVTVPPSPLFPALASICAPAATLTRCALGSTPLPCQSPPTATEPPPCVPDASSRAVPASATSPAVTSMRPP